MSGMAHEAKGTINDLIETCLDGQYGFEQAAREIGDPALRSELMQYSSQRREFATALQQALRSMGEEPAEKGSVGRTLHRGWINVKEAMSQRGDHAVLAECERGEDTALDSYRKALAEPVPPGVDDLVETQYSAIKHVHDRIRTLRDASKNVH